MIAKVWARYVVRTGILFCWLVAPRADALLGQALPASGIKYNFQPSASAIPAGYTPDTGQAYNGTRGWVMQNSLQNPSATPLDMRAHTRDRKVVGVDQRLNTLIHLQPTSGTPGAWEYALANGPYTVTASVGDPSYINSTHRINMEGGIAINNFIPTSSNKFFSLTSLVYVNDGKLTLDAIGGTNTKLNYVEISNAPTAASRPAVTSTNPKNGATNVAVTSAITADVHIPTAGAGVDQRTLSPSTVKLIRLSTNAQVAANINTSGGGDVIVVQPTTSLAPLTEYFFQVTSGVKDLAGAAFIPYAIRFTTRDTTPPVPTAVKFSKVVLPTTAGKTFTSVVIGPDRKLYAAVINGELMRFPINTDGTLGTGQSLQSLRTANNGDRMLIGLAFDPSSTSTNLILWVAHSAFVFSNGPDWAGKITRLSGTNLGTVRDYIVNLPRSVRDHVTNSLSFGPDGRLYINQGSNSAMGAPDNAWGNRPERVLNAALLQVNLSLITAPPLNVKSEGGGTYNPFAANAPVKVYASGIRNAYDHVWHSNGQLYVPTNGSASGGNTPATPSSLPSSCANRIDDSLRGDYTGPQVPGITNVTASQNDYLFRVVQNGYYGHPNPKRCEWVMNGGDPTTGTDPAQVTQYPDGTQPDRNWRGFAYDFGLHFSPNGIIEYKNNAFSGALKGRLLVVRYSSGDDIIVLTPDPQTLNIAQAQTGIQGFTGFNSPLDIIENTANGHLYVTEYGGQKITLLRPL